MASQVEIANRALIKVGDKRILSMTDDLEPARVLSGMWDTVRDAELRVRNWNFSITRASLAALVSTPDWGYDNQYQLPADCLRPIQIDEYFYGPSMSDYRNGSEAAYQIEGSLILTNLDAPLKIRYISRIEDTGAWDAAFTEAFACRLAVESCEKLTQSNSKKDALKQEYADAIRMAVRADAIENPNEPLPDNSWVLSRL